MSRAQGRYYGPKRIEQELRCKGVSQPLIQSVVGATFACGEEEKNAKALLQKKFRGTNLREPKTLRRARAFLERHGYSHRVIFDLVRRRAEDDDL